MYPYYTHKELLEKIDQQQVWYTMLGVIQLGQHILNPLRPDTNPGSCYLQEYKGKIILIDWASKEHSGLDCISAYMKMYPDKSWDIVCSDLLTCKVSAPSPYVYPGIKKKSKVMYFEPITCDWEQRHIDYLKLRGIRREQVERESTRVWACKGYILEKEERKIEYHFDELAFAYRHGEKYKIYFPNREKYRFIGNITQDDIWHVKRGSDTLLILKSAKDLLVTENLLDYDLTMIQGENFGHPSDLMVFSWETSYKRIILLFDGDESGLKGMKRFKCKFLISNPEIKFIPLELGVKDPDEMYINWGKERTKDYLTRLCQEDTLTMPKTI